MLKLVKEGRSDDALWVFEQLANKKQAVTLAVFSSRLVLKTYEVKYNSPAPRQAIEAAEAYLKNPCKKTKESAAKAAESAAKAARFAARSAEYAARSALQKKIIRKAIRILGLK